MNMNEISSTVYNYNFFERLFDKGWSGWKKPYFRNTQRVFEKNFSKMGLWLPHPHDSTKFGIFNELGAWSWMNRINTHPNCCLTFYNWCIEHDTNFFIELGNPKYHDLNSKKMWDYLDSNFDLFFTDKITDKHFKQIQTKCQKSWNGGNITSIAVILSLIECFGDITDIDFTFDYGDMSDMYGVDLSFTLPSGERKTMQIKSGKYLNMRDEFLIDGSPNSLEYDVDYYGYAHVNSSIGMTSVIFFQNSKELYKDEKYLVVNKDLVVCHKIEHMPIPELLNEILIITTKNNMEFLLKKEGSENFIIIDKEKNNTTINISDYNDNGLEKLLLDKLNELHQLFN